MEAWSCPFSWIHTRLTVYSSSFRITFLISNLRFCFQILFLRQGSKVQCGFLYLMLMIAWMLALFHGRSRALWWVTSSLFPMFSFVDHSSGASTFFISVIWIFNVCASLASCHSQFCFWMSKMRRPSFQFWRKFIFLKYLTPCWMEAAAVVILRIQNE